MQFNDEQLNIIDAPLDKNILVSAAAGSGKTTVLIERITRKILGENCNDKEISLSNILVMTFTKKATAEMKERIKNKIDERLAEGHNIKKLIRESSIIQNANISTIDSFCKRILEENYTALNSENSLYSDFDLTYRIADNQEIAVLWDDVLNAFLEREYGNIKYKPLFDAYVEKANDTPIRNLLKAGLLFLSSVPWPDEYLTMQVMDFKENSYRAYEEYLSLLINNLLDLKTKIIDNLVEIEEMKDLYAESYNSGLTPNSKPLTEAGKENLVDAINYFDELIGFLKEFEKFEFVVGDENKKIDKVRFAEIYEMAKQIVDKSPVFARVNCVTGIETEEYNIFKENTKSFINELNIVSAVYNILNTSLDRVYNENDKLYLEFLRDFYVSVLVEKSKRNLYEIGDYARMSLDILYDKNVDKDGRITRVISKRAKAIGNRYELIFVDEYQDTNLVQEKLIAAISDDFKKGNVFMVGDVKQSIYRFRNSEPSIFVNKLNSFKNGRGGLNKTLSTNYRSSKEIIGYVNDLFSKTMTLKYGDIDYDDGNALGLSENEINREIDNNKKVEIHIISKQEEGEDSNDSSHSAIEYEADYVASEIDRLVREEGYKYDDIVILLRVEKNKGKVFSEALKKYKIPSYSEQKNGFFDKLEIKLMIDMLSVIDNPLQDIALAAILKSNIFNVTNDELAFIRMYTKGLSLYDACIVINSLLGNSNDENDSKKIDELGKIIKKYGLNKETIKHKLDKFLKALNDLQFRSRYYSISKLIDYIYNSLNVKEIISAMNDGRLRSANLDMLYDFALKFENSSYVGLFNFNRYIKKINSVDVDLGQAKIFDENSDAVRIMTLHTSKGLQFKTVFLCNCNAKYNFSDLDIKNDYQFDKDYGVSLDYIDLKRGYKSNTPKKLLIASKKEDEIKQEELRMLYVALTRAKEKLYVTGVATRNTGFSEKDLENFVEKRSEGKNMGLSIKDCDCYLDVVLAHYPINDEKYCELFMPTWTLKDIPLDLDDDSLVGICDNVRDEEMIRKEDKEYFDSVESSFIDETLIDNYKFADYQKIRPKFSVSDLKETKIKNLHHKIFVYDKDDDDIDDAKTDKINHDMDMIAGQEIGNAYHRYMQFYNYEEGKYVCANANDSNLEKIIDREKIDAFLKSNIGQDMTLAFKEKRLYREQKFMKMYSQSDINDYMIDEENKITDIKSDVLNDKNIIIQGIIDAFYIKKDDKGKEYIVLLDYKTDSMRKKIIDREEIKKMLIDHYKLQLDIYAEALKELTGLDVKGKFLYSFAIDEAIEV